MDAAGSADRGTLVPSKRAGSTCSRWCAAAAVTRSSGACPPSRAALRPAQLNEGTAASRSHCSFPGESWSQARAVLLPSAHRMAVKDAAPNTAKAAIWTCTVPSKLWPTSVPRGTEMRVASEATTAAPTPAM